MSRLFAWSTWDAYQRLSEALGPCIKAVAYNSCVYAFVMHPHSTYHGVASESITMPENSMPFVMDST